MQFLKALFQKLQKRCPVKYAVVRNASLSRKINIKYKVSGFAERLFKLKWLTVHEADDADLQHYEFIDSECSKHRNIFHIQ